MTTRTMKTRPKPPRMPRWPMPRRRKSPLGIAAVTAAAPLLPRRPIPTVTATTTTIPLSLPTRPTIWTKTRRNPRRSARPKLIPRMDSRTIRKRLPSLPPRMDPMESTPRFLSAACHGRQPRRRLQTSSRIAAMGPRLSNCPFRTMVGVLVRPLSTLAPPREQKLPLHSMGPPMAIPVAGSTLSTPRPNLLPLPAALRRNRRDASLYSSGIWTGTLTKRQSALPLATAVRLRRLGSPKTGSLVNSRVSVILSSPRPRLPTRLLRLPEPTCWAGQ
mmetsp:Transcript_36872/g.75142  ORF Transcript_36872/g.75142 Transcript_36872/m.75142 type:complete len:274 (+) Transcript_36872:445-1266(+)